MKLPTSVFALAPKTTNRPPALLSNSALASAQNASSRSLGVTPAGECGCPGNRECVGPCILGSCAGECARVPW